MSRLDALRRLLFAPRSFFRRRAPDYDLRGAAGVALVTVLVSCLALLAMGQLFALHVDATYTETTMEPMSAGQCERFAELNEETNVSTTPEACAIDEPRTRQVDVGERARDLLYGRLPVLVLGAAVGFLLLGGVLHLLVRLVGGDAPFRDTMAVVGWGSLPTVLQSVAAVLAVHLALAGTAFTADGGAAVRELARIATGGFHPVGLAGRLVASGWQAYIWAGGLQETQELRWEEAWLVAVVVAVGGLLLSLA